MARQVHADMQQQQPALSATVSATTDAAAAIAEADVSAMLTPQQRRLASVLATVVPFDAVGLSGGAPLTWSAQRGLSVLEEASAALYREIAVGSFSGGLAVTVQGRLKSLRSVHTKMLRKDCSLEASAVAAQPDKCHS